MKIEKEDIKKIARLAKIEIDPKNEDKFISDLENILEYVDQLKDIELENYQEIFSVAGAKNVWREDFSDNTQEGRQSLIDNLVDHEDGYAKVKRIL